MEAFLIGVFGGFAVIGLGAFIAHVAAILRARVDTHRAIDEFCKDRDYCYFGCGKGNEDGSGYWGGYHCPGDHK